MLVAGIQARRMRLAHDEERAVAAHPRDPGTGSFLMTRNAAKAPAAIGGGKPTE